MITTFHHKINQLQKQTNEKASVKLVSDLLSEMANDGDIGCLEWRLLDLPIRTTPIVNESTRHLHAVVSQIQVRFKAVWSSKLNIRVIVSRRAATTFYWYL